MSRLDGKVCSVEELALAAQPNPPVYCLTRGQTIGLTLASETGLISAIAVFCVLCMVANNKFRRHRGRRLFQEPTDIYVLSLFVADFIQAIGAALDIKWVDVGKLHNGSYCTFQGVVQQLGETAVAMSTLAIAAHTFVVVWVGRTDRTQSLKIASTLTALIWLFVILFVGIAAGTHRDKANLYIVFTPYWCWVGRKYLSDRIAGEYFWLWFTMFASLIFYGVLSLRIRGNIVPIPGRNWRFAFHWRNVQPDVEQNRLAYRMIAYPVVYSILIVPLSVVRWIGFQLEKTHNGVNTMSSAAQLGVITVYGLSGVANVLLFFLIRSNLLLFQRPEPVVGMPLLPAGLPPDAPAAPAHGEEA